MHVSFSSQLLTLPRFFAGGGILLLSSLLLLAGCGPRTPNEVAQSEAGAVPVDSLSDEGYVTLPSSRVSIVPPLGFQVATKNPMLVRADSAMLVALEQTNMGFYEHLAGLGVRLGDAPELAAALDRELTVAGYSARFVSQAVAPGRNSHILVFGDSTFSVLVRAVFPTNDAAADQALRQAMYNIRYDQTKPATPALNRYYYVADDEPGFLLSHSWGSTDDYTPNDQQIMMPAGVSVMVTEVPAAGKSLTQLRGEFTRLEAQDGNAYTDQRVRRASSASIGGYEAYEAELDCRMGAVSMGLYMAQLKLGNQSVYLEAFCPAETFAATLPEFKRFTRAIRFKE